jgi:hypothetical protein
MTENSDSTQSVPSRIEERRKHFQYLSAISRLPRSIELAEIGVLPFAELLARVAHIWTEDDPTLVIDQVIRRERTEEQQIALIRVLEELVVEADNLRGRDRIVADRTIYRLLHLLPKPLAGALVLRCAESKRSMQRQAAYRFYKSHGIEPGVVGMMLDDYRHRPRQAILNVIARDPNAVAEADPEFLLHELVDRYWRMRVFQALLQADPEKAEALAFQYPIEYLWAATRERDETVLPMLRQLLDANMEDPEFVGWSLWAFSKLGSPLDVALARSFAESLIAGAPSDAWGSTGAPHVATRNQAA